MFKNFLLLISLTLISVSVHAAQGEVSGQIAIVRSHDVSLSADWFQLDVASVGSCATVGGKVVFLVKDDDRGKRQLSMALAAKMGNKEVTVGYDDSALVNDSWCYARYLDIR